MSIRALALYTKITHTCLNASQSTGKRRAATEGIAAVILQGRTLDCRVRILTEWSIILSQFLTP